MTENGLTFNPAMCGSAHHVSECLTRHLPKLLEQGYTAIACRNVILAHSVMVHCKKLGLRVPEDISILSYDDIPLCRYTIYR